MAAVLDAFDADLARHWTLADLSTEVYVGSFHLAHEFKRWMGVSPMAYLARRRAKRAAILLAGTDDSIASIGRAVGWPEPAAFSRQFSKAFGVSPREFRRRRAAAPAAEDIPELTPDPLGGNAWESNPPRRAERRATGFEDQGTHRDPTAPIAMVALSSSP